MICFVELASAQHVQLIYHSASLPHASFIILCIVLLRDLSSPDSVKKVDMHNSP
jgi:hypothetical protein